MAPHIHISNVPADLRDGLLQAPSKRAYFNRSIRHRYDYTLDKAPSYLSAYGGRPGLTFTPPPTSDPQARPSHRTAQPLPVTSPRPLSGTPQGTPRASVHPSYNRPTRRRVPPTEQPGRPPHKSSAAARERKHQFALPILLHLSAFWRVESRHSSQTRLTRPRHSSQLDMRSKLISKKGVKLSRALGA